MEKIISELTNLNYTFLANNKNGIKLNNQSYIYKNGEIPIVLSAPHAVRQCRESKVKASDYLTGPLAMYLAEKCNCSYFVRTFNENDDPNFPIGITLPTIQNEYLIELKKYITNFNQMLVIDLHGCSDERLYDCSLWTDNYKTCSQEMVKTFENNFSNLGLTVDMGSEYLGGQATRQTSLVTSAIQIEVKRKIRSLKKENYQLLKSFIDAMEKSIYDAYDYSIKNQKIKIK